MADERPADDATPTPIAWEPPETVDELRAEQREVREAANSETALRGASVVGALGGNVPIGSGALVGRGGALGVEETDREEELDDRVHLGEDDASGDDARRP
jgi:hypothetical protein